MACRKLSSLFLLLNLFTGLIADDPVVLDAQWKITTDSQIREQSVSRNLMYAIGTYRSNNDGAFPSNFSQLDEDIVEQLSAALGQPVSSRFILINEQRPLKNDNIKDWRLVLISKQKLNIGGSQQAKGRHLVYADSSGKLRQITEPEEWFETHIQDSIPGVIFGEEEVSDATAIEQTPNKSEVSVEQRSVQLPDEDTQPEALKNNVLPQNIADETAEHQNLWWLWAVGLPVVIVLVLIAIFIRNRRRSP